MPHNNLIVVLGRNKHSRKPFEDWSTQEGVHIIRLRKRSHHWKGDFKATRSAYFRPSGYWVTFSNNTVPEKAMPTLPVRFGRKCLLGDCKGDLCTDLRGVSSLCTLIFIMDHLELVNPRPAVCDSIRIWRRAKSGSQPGKLLPDFGD